MQNPHSIIPNLQPIQNCLPAYWGIKHRKTIGHKDWNTPSGEYKSGTTEALGKKVNRVNFKKVW